jgi:glucan biosynthesis protein C
MAADSSTRRYDIDWLRVFATYLLFLFHVAMVFNPAPFYHIRNAEVSFVVMIVAGFISLWHMPLFFLLAGWSIFSSLAERGSGSFLKERFFRLWIPLVMACVLLMPPVKFLELKSGLDASYSGLRVSPKLQQSFTEIIPSGLPVAPVFDETFLEFLPTFFTHLERFSWGHLWFVAYLLTFTVLYLPLFSALRRNRDWQGPASPLWIYLPIVPLAVVQVTMRERWPGLQNLYDDWANFAYYSIYLLCGFMLARHPALEEAVVRERKRALAVGTGATLVLLLAVLGVFSSAPILLAGTAVAGWCFVLALLGFARVRLSFTNPALAYLTESAFPVYLLHQSAIVLIGYPLLRLELGIAPKFALLLVASAAATLAVYHFGVRPFSVPRFLCGMKLRRRPGIVPLARRVETAALVIAITLFSGRTASFAASPLGLWYAEGGAARVEVTACGDTLCGRVVWLRSPFDEDGCELRDRQNPDPSLRDRSLIGLEILHGLEHTGANTWEGGSIYDPTTGNTYRARLLLDGENRVQLRGYVGIPLLGRTTQWFRVGAEEQICREGG